MQNCEKREIDVSVIIVSWNTQDILCDCINSIYQQTNNEQFEVIVVDNASSDGSVDMVQSEFRQVKIIKNNENRGFAAANNQGITVAQGRYVLLLNSDTVVLNGVIDKVVAFADSSPKAGIIGCRVLDKEKISQPSCFLFPSVLNLFLATTYLYKLCPKSKFFGREHMTWWNRDDVREVDVVTGCFMLVRREAIEQVGLLDERFFMYAEETDWCYRFKQAGWQIMFTPNAEIIHLHGASSRQVKPKMISQWRKSMLFFFEKHRDPLTYGLVWILIALFFATRVPYWSARVLISKIANTLCCRRQFINV
jgi:GT2 family glycosyltransferase